MGRPSVQDQRKKEVLDAFMTCVVSYGVEGATLEHIAAAAGLKRPLIRHHLGNRKAMVLALGEHIAETLSSQSEALRVALADHPGVRSLIEALFNSEGELDPRINICYQSLVNSVEIYPELRQPLLDSMDDFYKVAMDIVLASHPKADKQACEIVAHGIVNLYITTDAFIPLKPPKTWAYSSYFAALKLAETLESKP
ncbi:TetR/AcrR family transcriptional regulator [Ruegeria arenilitoris]|uniref:TetR/AcrR family transcriptional regulator n=1 Tax=Ruegeria arenilitoris TaxID=1173585 RepID=UPI00147DDF59|nr:TetR/AcrR family transcriptional regulator [Ruegeria arenilitoris]